MQTFHQFVTGRGVPFPASPFRDLRFALLTAMTLLIEIMGAFVLRSRWAALQGRGGLPVFLLVGALSALALYWRRTLIAIGDLIRMGGDKTEDSLPQRALNALYQGLFSTALLLGMVLEALDVALHNV